MPDTHIDPLILALGGGFISVLLTVIAFFLSRLLVRFDGLTSQVGSLNETMLKIDKDLSGRVGVLDIKHVSMERRIEEMSECWNRLRLVEQDVVAIKAQYGAGDRRTV